MKIKYSGGQASTRTQENPSLSTEVARRYTLEDLHVLLLCRVLGCTSADPGISRGRGKSWTTLLSPGPEGCTRDVIRTGPPRSS